MRSLIFSLFMCITLISSAQVTIIINDVPENTPVDADIYIAGDLNSWDPINPDFKLTKLDGPKWQIIIPAMDEGSVIQFKFTRGSWETVEKGIDGEEIENRLFTFGNGDTIRPVILNWADFGGGGVSTASENVSIMDEAFNMPQFNRERRIWIYLPPNYETSQSNFPVIYMHDGQNLFDAMTSYAGEWEVDETLDKLAAEGFNVPIVVGIDNGGGNRIDEYTPWINAEYGGGDGSLYIDFLVETLKPFIDNNYKTIANRENTAIIGSSLGGLISHYGGIKHQEVFGKIGIFSPSYWFSDSIWTFTNSFTKQYLSRFYQMCGDNEGETTVADMQQMDDYLHNIGFTNDELFQKVIPGGQHNEQLWRSEFEEAYKWLFKDYLGSIENHIYTKELIIIPNPAISEISFKDFKSGDFDSIEIFSVEGKVVMTKRKLISNRIDISELKSGCYFVKISGENSDYQGQFIKK